MRLLLLADNDVGKGVFSYLLENFYSDLAMVVVLNKNDIYEKSISEGIPIKVLHKSDDISEFIKKMNLSFDLGLMTWWPNIIKKELLSLPKKGFINLHPSLLPYNKGKYPNFWAIVESVPFGVSLHYADDGVDTGDIISQKKIDYDWCDTGETLYLRAKRIILELFKETYPLLRKNKNNRIKQNHGEGSFHIASDADSECHIKLDKKYLAKDLFNILRARTFSGYPSCYFYDNDEKYEVRIKIRRIVDE